MLIHDLIELLQERADKDPSVFVLCCGYSVSAVEFDGEAVVLEVCGDPFDDGIAAGMAVGQSSHR